MEFAWPVALLGLAALALPLLIHLLARGEFKHIEIATTRYLRDHTSARLSRLQVEHPLLLALRIILIVLCVTLLAEPYRLTEQGTDSFPAWNLVSTQLPASQVNPLLEQTSAESRWLAPGFPGLDQPRPEWRPNRLWSLLSAADRQAPEGTAFHVVVPSSVYSPGSYRPSLKRPLRWIDGGPVSATPARAADRLTVDIVFDPEREADAASIINAIGAWQDIDVNASARTVPIETVSTLSPYVVWLSEKPLPAMTDKSRTIIAERTLLESASVLTGYVAHGASAVSEQRAGRLRIHIVDPLFVVDESLSPSLARDLLALFMDTRLTTAPTDYPVTRDQLVATQSDMQTQISPRARQPLTRWLLWLIGVAAALERVISARAMRATHDT